MFRKHAIILLLVLSSCTLTPKVKTMNIYIPMNYHGWVAIVFNIDSGHYAKKKSNNEINYFVVDKPCFFPVKNDIYDEGYYNVNVYYYNSKDTFKLKNSGEFRQVSDQSVRHYKMSKNNIEVFNYHYLSFYVSDTIKSDEDLFNEMRGEKEDICIN